MKKILTTVFKIILSIAVVFAFISFIYYIFENPKINEKELVSVYPEKIYKGDPVFVEISASSSIVKALYDGKDMDLFFYNKSYLSIIPTDFYEKNNEHSLYIEFTNGISEKRIITINDREKIERPLGIPEKLGGNTKAAANKIVSNLANENYVLNNVLSDKKQYWTEGFYKPLESLSISDTYGYNRNTVGQIIVHKGLDFRAKKGLQVFSMNGGVVKIAQKFDTYGNTVVIDHGFGLLTLYMHLSEINVKKGDTVKRGSVIGLSGDTGYATGPHLHLSIKINGVSIDPAVFMKYFKIIP